MKSIFLIIVIAASLAGAASVRSQDRAAKKFADRISTDFNYGLGRLDRLHLVRGNRLQVSLQLDEPDTAGGQKEFSSKTFRSFGAMERWMKSEEQSDGTPFRMSGEHVSCRKGVCRLRLAENQMMHNHVYLTWIWYGRSRGKLYVRKIRLLYG